MGIFLGLASALYPQFPNYTFTSDTKVPPVIHRCHCVSATWNCGLKEQVPGTIVHSQDVCD